MNVPDPMAKILERCELGRVVVGGSQHFQVGRNGGEQALWHSVAADRGDLVAPTGRDRTCKIQLRDCAVTSDASAPPGATGDTQDSGLRVIAGPATTDVKDAHLRGRFDLIGRVAAARHHRNRPGSPSGGRCFIPIRGSVGGNEPGLSWDATLAGGLLGRTAPPEPLRGSGGLRGRGWERRRLPERRRCHGCLSRHPVLLAVRLKREEPGDPHLRLVEGDQPLL